MARMKDKCIKCPYYKWEEGLVQCCGVKENVFSAPLHFYSKELRLEYKRRYCKKDWEECPLAAAINSGFGY